MSDVNLKDTNVYRGGATVQRRDWETNVVYLSAGSPFFCLYFNVASKGGGTTTLEVRVGEKDFRDLLRAMVESSRQAAMAGMAKILAEAINQQPDQDATVVRKAREEVVSEVLMQEGDSAAVAYSVVKPVVEELNGRSSRKKRK